MNIKIAVCYHKKDLLIKDDKLMPILLGGYKISDNLEIQKDCEKDNISEKNYLYSELTGLYWLWKNTQADIKGLYHYRRLLSYHGKDFKTILSSIYRKLFSRFLFFISGKRYNWCSKITTQDTKYFKKEIYNCSRKIEEYFTNGYDIIVPIPIHYYPLTVIETFSGTIDKNLQKCVIDVIKEYYPSYQSVYISVIKSHTIYYGNITVMKDYLFNEYCTFLFGILFKLEQRIIKEGLYYDTHEKALSRKFGYIAELLTSTYVIAAQNRGIRIKELKVIEIK